MIVTAHIKFSLYTTFLDQMVQAEDERLPGESIEDGVIRVHKQLEAAVQKIKDAHRIDLSGFAMVIPNGISEGWTPKEEFKYKPEGTTEINLQWEKAEIAIENAETLEQLEVVLQQHDALPGRLIALANAKRKLFKELSNG